MTRSGRNPDLDGDIAAGSDRLDRLVRDSPYAAALTQGSQHTVLAANDAFCRLVQTSEEVALGRPLAEIHPAASKNEPFRLLDRVLQTGTGEKDHEVTVEGGDEGSMVWSYAAWPVAGNNGSPVGAVLQIDDRTERAEAQRRLEEIAGQIRRINERLLGSAVRERQLAERAETATRAKSSFLALISHELRTPLTGIVGYVDVLESGAAGPLSDKQAESTKRIKHCATFLGVLIEDLLAFTQAQAEDGEIRPGRVDLGSLAEEVAGVVRPVAASRGLTLELQTPESPLWGETDGEKVRTIVLHLLSNAVKFTGDEGRVSVEVKRSGNEADLVVRDSGIGIADEHLPHLFDPFFQAEPITTRRFGGMGLGLATSRVLAARLGGEIRVESTPGEGSAFHLRIPLRLPEAGERERAS